MIARPQVGEVVLQWVGPGRQGQEICRGGEGYLDLRCGPAGRAGVKGELRSDDAAIRVVAKVRGQYAVGGLQGRVGVDQVHQVLDERGNGGARGGVGHADGYLCAVRLGEVELEPIAHDRRIARKDAEVTRGSSIEERGRAGVSSVVNWAAEPMAALALRVTLLPGTVTSSDCSSRRSPTGQACTRVELVCAFKAAARPVVTDATVALVGTV